MAMTMLVVDSRAPEPTLGTAAVERLAALGVTRLALLRDGAGVGIVLEGWAFDPADVDTAVGIVFPDAATRVRTLREVSLVALARGEGSR